MLYRLSVHQFWSFFLSRTLFVIPCTYLYICTFVKTNTSYTECCSEATLETVSSTVTPDLNESSERLMDLAKKYHRALVLYIHVMGIDRHSTQISLIHHCSCKCAVHITFVDFDPVYCWHTTCFCSSVKIHDLAEMKEIYAIITLEDTGGIVYYWLKSSVCIDQ